MLRSGQGAVVRLGNLPFSPDIPIELKGGGAEVDLTVERATSNDFTIDLLERDAPLVTIRLGTDWLAVLGGWSEALMSALLAIPALAGALATFFGDLRTQLVKLAAILGRRRSAE